MARFGYADTPEGQVPYIEEGQGEPLVMLHLAPRSARCFLRLMPHISENYRVIAVDMLGFGEAPSIPERADGTLDLDAVSRNVTSVMDHLGVEKAHLFGVHTGAHFAARAAGNHPERFQSLMLFGLGMREDQQDAALNVSAMEKYSEFPLPRYDGTHLVGLWSRWYQDVLRYWMISRMPPRDDEAPDVASMPSPYRPMSTFLREDELDFMEKGVIDSLRVYRRNGMIAHHDMMVVDMPAMLGKIPLPTMHLDPESPYESPFCRRGKRVAELVPNGEYAVVKGVDEHACELAPAAMAPPILDFLKRFPF